MCSTSVQLSVLVWSFLFCVKMFSFLFGSVCSTYRSFFLKPHEYNISLFLYLLPHPSQLLPYQAAFTLGFFFPLTLNCYFHVVAFLLALVTFSFKFPIAFRDTQSNSTSFIYHGRSQFYYLFQAFSLADSFSLSSHLPCQSSCHKLHLLSGNSFLFQSPTWRRITRQSLTQHLQDFISSTLQYHPIRVIWKLTILFELGYIFILKHCFSAELFK